MADAGSPFDLAALARMVGPDPAELADAVALFLDSARAWQADARDAAARGDRAALGRLGHRLKSSAAALGAIELASACAALEREGAGAGTPDDLEVAVDRAQHALARVIAGLADPAARDQAISSAIGNGRANR